MDNKFKCPECGHPQYCPCDSCKVHFPAPEGVKYWEWQSNEESIACGNCGVIKHVDEWMDLSVEYYENIRARKLIEMESNDVEAKLSSVQVSDSSK